MPTYPRIKAASGVVDGTATYAGKTDITLKASDLASDPYGVIQQAVTDLQAAHGGRLKLPVTQQVLTDTVLITGAAQTADTWGTGGIEIIGAGLRGTQLQGPSGKPAFQLGTSSSKVALALRDFSLIGPGISNSLSLGIYSKSVGGSYVLDNVLVEKFEIGLRFHDNTLVSADHLNVRECGEGLALGYFSDVHQYRSCRFDNCTTGVHVGYYSDPNYPAETSPNENHATSFVGCLMNGNGIAALIEGAGSDAISFRDCYIEQYTTVGIMVGEHANVRSVSAVVAIDNCFFNGNAGGTKKDHAIEVNNANNVQVRGGGFRNHLKSAVNVRNNNAKVMLGPANFDHSSGESGDVLLPDGTTYLSALNQRPLTVGRLSQTAVNVAISTPTASIDWDGALLRVSGTTYECGPDGVGGYAWYARPLARNLAVAGGGVTERFVQASDFVASQGVPNLAVAATKWRVFYLDPASQEGVLASVGLPSGWSTFNVDLYWVNDTANAGDVVWSTSYLFAGDGSTITASASSTANVTVTSNAQNVSKVTRLGSGLTVGTGMLSLRVFRVAADAGDTMAGDAAVMGVLLTKAS